MSKKNDISSESKEQYMREAIRLATENVANGGGPFGAVIVKDGKIVGRGVNRVTANCDPTAHAEVSAIRDATSSLKTFDLSGCEIYTSCEPCPMCLGAIYWARLHHIYYGNTQADAAKIDFDDSFIYRQIEKPIGQRNIPEEQMLHEESIVTFNEWAAKDDKTPY
ncbi:MAG: nucleoside deaminase [Bacteroidales bacterium]|nr:nucleoside deaminase [Bacteroidales bacterium]